MHPTSNFLRLLWPAVGRKTIVTIKNGLVQHLWYDPDELQDAADAALGAAANGLDVYFALAGFSCDERKQNKIVAIKSLWLDVDVGEDKAYKSKTEAGAALATFLKDTGLPTPLIVSSGYGLHVYFPLQTELTLPEWRVQAEKLKRLCQERKLYADLKCTSDGARILRPIGTQNFKNGAPRAVKVLNKQAISIDEAVVYAALANVQADPFVALALQMPEGAKTPKPIFDDSPPADFQQIVANCATVRWAYVYQDQVSEPLWYDCLGVAGYCADGRTQAHALSARYPGYDPGNTERKLAQRTAAAGPTTCQQFRTQVGSQCVGCPHRITSPIQLGRAKNTVGRYTKTLGGTITRYADPNIRVTQTGLEIKVPDGKPDSEGNQAWHWVYLAPHGINPMLELRLPDGAAAASNHVWLETYDHLGQVKDNFVVPAQGIANSQQFSTDCSKRGYYLEGETAPGAYRRFHKIMRTWVAQMKAKQGPIVTFRSFGWTGPDGKDAEKDAFLLGTTLYTRDGEYTTPLIPELATLQADFRSRGELAKWTAAMDNYNLPGMEPYMFASWIGWGAPLMQFTVTGSIIFHILGDTGVGKSSLQRSILSIYGDYHSKQLLDVADSTTNSVGGMMGLLNSLPYLREEATERPIDELVAWALSVTHGRERGRLNANLTNAQARTWSTIAMTSANHSLREAILTRRMDNAARLARIWEQELELPFSQAQAVALFGAMSENYGLAGPIYIDYNVRNRDMTRSRVMEAEQYFSRKLDARGPDRFFISMLAVCYVGAQIGNELGLIHHDIQRGMQFGVRHFKKLRQNAEDEKPSPEQTLSRFIQEMQPQTMAVEIDNPAGVVSSVLTSDQNIIRNVTNANCIAMRYAKDTTTFYSSIPEIRKWYADNHMNFDSDMRKLESDGILVARMKRTVLTRGTRHADNKQAWCMWFDLSKSKELIDSAQQPI